MVASLNRGTPIDLIIGTPKKVPIIWGNPCMFMWVAVKIMVSFLNPYYDTALHI